MKNRYYLMRHGESVANRKGLIVSKPDHAISDYGLTSKGSEQVTKTAIETRLDGDLVLVSSDYLRARQTAEIMQGVISIDRSILFDEGLRERDFGDLELSDHSNYQSVWKNDVTAPQRKVNGVETISEILKRTQLVIQRLEQQFENSTLLLVGHGDVLQILLAQYRHIEPRFHRTLKPIGNAHIRLLADSMELKSVV